MVFGLWKRRKDLTPYTFYQSTMEQSRHPAFYATMGVPDTIEGRFDMLIAHAILVLRRLKTIKGDRQEEATDRQQSYADLLFKDLDRAMRETGVGDVSVPKKMNKLASAFFGRAKIFGEALDAQDQALMVDALNRNTHGGAFDDLEPAAKPDKRDTPGTLDAQALASYLMEAENALNAQSEENFLSGTLSWPALADPVFEDETPAQAV